MTKIYLGILVLALAVLRPGTTLQAQDIHFSHIHASPTYLNPAMTGIFEGDYRFIANYRQQWRNTTANYRTIAASFDTRLWSGRTGFLSMGVSSFADQAGDLDYSTGFAGFSLGASRALNRRGDSYLTLALQGSFLHNSLNFDKLYVFDEEPAISAGASSVANVFDLAAGLSWYSVLRNDHKIYLGTAVFHIAEPDMAMLGAVLNYEENLKRKYVFHGGGEVLLNKRWDLMPSFIFLEQAPHREITMGSFLSYHFDEHRDEEVPSVFLGAWLRWFFRPDAQNGVDALILTARMDKDRLSVALSYDVNISSLKKATKGMGGPEISISYRGDYNIVASPNRRRKIKCPKF